MKAIIETKRIALQDISQEVVPHITYDDGMPESWNVTTSYLDNKKIRNLNKSLNL